MDQEEASGPHAFFEYDPFGNRNNREAPPPTYHIDDDDDDDDDDRQHIPGNGNYYEPPTRYHFGLEAAPHFGREATPNFESALRSHARPPLERADSSASAERSRTAGLYLPRVEHMASSATRRFAGDGFDYRRPAGSAQQSQATASVDLTGDDDMDEDDTIHVRQDDTIHVRQDNNVIDLTADDSGYGASHDGQIAHQAREPRRERERQREQQESHSHRNRRHAPRLPRGMDIIIDLDNGDEEWNVDAPAPGQAPSSPEIEFISSRTIPGGRRPHSSLSPLPNGLPRDNSDGDEEVEFLRANALPEHEQRRRQANEQMDNVLDLFTLNGRFTHLRAQIERFHDQVNRTRTQFGNQQEPVAPSRSASRGRAPHIRVGVGAFMAPVMDFEMVGFEIGPRGGREAPAPSPPTYTAPPKAPEGFTRSPEEDGGALVCPNCEDELCVGGDETKRQVWIVKGCGHVSSIRRRWRDSQLMIYQVYCGECTTNRSIKRSAKGKERPANTLPFKTCVVDGCDKNVTNKKSMIQVFL